MTGRRVQPFVTHGGTILEMTPREYRVLVYLAASIKQEHMSRALRISRSTINTYADRFYSMAGAQNRGQLAIWAVLTGLVKREDIWALWARFNPELAAWQQPTEGTQ